MTPMSVTAMVDRSGISLRKAPLRESMTSLWLGVTRTSGSRDRGSRILVPERVKNVKVSSLLNEAVK